MRILLSAERNECGTTDKPLTAEECIKGALDQSIEGKVIIINPACLSAEYRTPDHQIKLATGGSGCSPDSRGSAVFCTDLYSGKTSRFERYDVAGVADITKLPGWAQQRITELDKTKDKPSMLETLAKNKIVAAQQETKKNEKKKEVQEL